MSETAKEAMLQTFWEKKEIYIYSSLPCEIVQVV